MTDGKFKNLPWTRFIGFFILERYEVGVLAPYCQW